MPRLSYCTNFYPTQNYQDLLKLLNTFLPKLRKAGNFGPLHVGLYLPNSLSQEILSEASALAQIFSLFQKYDLSTTTLNGFPYGDFHTPHVKEKVYFPNWHEEERYDYTCRLIEILQNLMGEHSYGSISTVAFGLKASFERSTTINRGFYFLGKIARKLEEVEKRSGKRIVLGLEPEPFTYLQSTAEAVDFFQRGLWRKGAHILAESESISVPAAREILQRYLGVCYDCCHQAVIFENIQESLDALTQAGIAIAKVQLSNALELRSLSALQELEQYKEPRYLHQTFVQSSDHSIESYFDLPQALNVLRQPKTLFQKARVHFHVPLFWDQSGAFGSTRQELEKTLELVIQNNLCQELEIETYTWDVLANGIKNYQELEPLSQGASGINTSIVEEEIIQGMAQEIAWTEKKIAEFSS